MLWLIPRRAARRATMEASEGPTIEVGSLQLAAEDGNAGPMHDPAPCPGQSAFLEFASVAVANGPQLPTTAPGPPPVHATPYRFSAPLSHQTTSSRVEGSPRTVRSVGQPAAGSTTSPVSVQHSTPSTRLAAPSRQVDVSEYLEPEIDETVNDMVTRLGQSGTIGVSAMEDPSRLDDRVNLTSKFPSTFLVTSRRLSSCDCTWLPVLPS